MHLLTLLDMGAEGTKTAASECLRSLSLHKPVITCLGEQHNLQAIVEAIPFALMEQKVHLMAIISEISYLENGAEKILNSGALPSLASIVKNAGSEIAAKCELPSAYLLKGVEKHHSHNISGHKSGIDSMHEGIMLVLVCKLSHTKELTGKPNPFF